MSKKKKEWRAEKERLLSLGLEERRKDYRGSYVTLDKISTWANQDNNTATEEEELPSYTLANKVSVYKGDITILEVDAIVNAANSSLLGGGGVDGCIHRAAGHLLYDECHSLNGCDTGKAKITCGYDLPAKYVIHTVGPVARGNVGQSQRDDLESCYKNSLKLVKDNNLKSVAFPCISTGIYGFPNEPAAEIALRTVKDWILSNRDEIDRVIFCVFLEMDYEIYNRKMSDFFSPDNDGHEEEEDAKMEDDNTQTKGEDDATQGDKKEDVEMMSQSDEIYADDVKMGSQKQDDSPDDETLEQVKEKSEKGDSKVEESPAAKENLEEGNKEKEREEDKKENNGGDTEVAGEEKGGSPEKKMQTGQTDEEGQQRKDPTKSAGTQEGTIEEAEVAMDVHDADKSETESAMEKNTTSTKVEMKAQDKSSQEPASIPTDSSQSKDGQVSKCAQRKE